MNKLSKAIFSMPLMAFMLIIFALSCAIATFIENDFGTETAWAVVYSSWWFEFVQVFLGATLAYNIIRFKMYKKDKLPALMFHISLLFILLGSGLTRYFGFEGSLNIREGNSNNIITSSEPSINIKAYKKNLIYTEKYKKLISHMQISIFGKEIIGNNNFNFSFDVGEDKVYIKFKEFIPRAVKNIIEDENGVPTIALVVSNEGEGTQNIILRMGEAIQSNNIVYTFNTNIDKQAKPLVRFTLKDKKFYVNISEDTNWLRMKDMEKGSFEKDLEHNFTNDRLYSIGNENFAVKYLGLKGKETFSSEELQPMSNTKPYDALALSVTYQNITKDVVLRGLGRGYNGKTQEIHINDAAFVLDWGSSSRVLPFMVKLNDFQLERYPGSNSPSSYASEITLIDSKNNITMPYRIFMNNVLDYGGYRFFQASYDQDELGTILSVNNDPGKWPTYFGYLLLGIGMFWNIVSPKSRFRKLATMLNKDMNKKIVSFFILLSSLLFMMNPMQANAQETSKDSIEFLKKYDKKHADNFGTILVQSMDGRVKPIDTVAHEILNKVYRGDNIYGLTANQVILGMVGSTYGWQAQPIVKLSHPELKKLIGVDKNAKHASFNDFFNKDGTYILTKYVETASRKKDAEKNQLDKDLIKVNERLNILFSTFNLDIFKMFPKVADENNAWYSVDHVVKYFPFGENNNVTALLIEYFDALKLGVENGKWNNADAAVEKIKEYQQKFGKKIMPSVAKQNAEILFNELKIFDRLTFVYLFSGLILLGLVFAKMIQPKFNVEKYIKVFFYINLVAFCIHTFGLGLRWFVAEHAPWSNSYESMIYIAWAMALAGLFFAKTSYVSMSLTYILTGITLFSAHLSWLDPQITNLMPVLKSPWLTIHVSVITASYGFFGLCALLGFFVLILFAVQSLSSKKGFKENIDRNITEASRINEMSMILGLCLLTFGNFLGGVWANESWGRYWGWDPKETWSLISILIYATIVHLRFVPKLNTQFAFALCSTIAYASIIMTYFGVNFYLSGMHSYAGGDPVPVPNFVYYTVLVVTLTAIIAYICARKNKRLLTKI